MVNGKIDSIGLLLKSAFQEGFSNASHSLGLLTGEKISYSNLRHAACQLEEADLQNGDYGNHRDQSHILLTTDLFGEISGKSYLFLSEQEFQSVTHNIPDSGGSVNLKEEFIKELDNILSAAVISKLSDRFHRKMFGDVPILIGKVNSKIEDVIYDDFIEQTSEVYIHTAAFSFEKNPQLNPLFIWVFDRSIVDEMLAKTA